jgi:hypothetical protein
MTDVPVDGLAALNNRVERAKRSVPPPRHPRGPSELAAEAPAPRPASGTTPEDQSESAARSAPPPSTERPTGKPSTAKAHDALLKALPDASTVMLGARVRVPLDDLLTDLVHEVRQHQVKTSKVELVEMALLSLVGVDGATIAERVREFRSQTGRYLVRR